MIVPAVVTSTKPEVDEHIPNKFISLPKDSLLVATADTTKNVVANVPASDGAVVDSMTAATVEVIVPEKSGEHIVKQGETLHGIAKMYNVGVMDLVNWNGVNLQVGIKPGQVLKTVAPATEESVVTPEKLPAIEHEVKPTDTLYGIARKYNVTIKELDGMER